MNIRTKIKELLNKPVKDREEWEHQVLIHMNFDNRISDYLTSLGNLTVREVITTIDKLKVFIKERNLDFVAVELLKEKLTEKIKEKSE